MNYPYSMVIQWSEADQLYLVHLPDFPWQPFHTHGSTYEGDRVLGGVVSRGGQSFTPTQTSRLDSSLGQASLPCEGSFPHSIP